MEERIYLAGHEGMVGSNLLNHFRSKGYKNIITKPFSELDLTDSHATQEFFEDAKPDIVILAAGKVGGIGANTKYPAEFIYQNSMIELNVIHSAHVTNVKKLIFFGTSSVYPKNATQPIKEEELLTGEFEKTNEPYSLAKITGIKLCEYYYKEYSDNFYAVMPANLYGPYDHFEPEKSHVIPALIYKIHKAEVENRDKVELWGTGAPLREFLFAPDLAEIIIHFLNHIDAIDIYKRGISVLNIGSGEEISIKELANLIKEIIGYKGEVVFDVQKPDGIMRKSLDGSRLKELGWNSFTKLNDGLKETYKWYLNNL
jgi:GDP-L-fucose synthase